MSRRSRKEDKESYEHSRTTLKPYRWTKPNVKTLKEMSHAIPASRKERPDHWRLSRHRPRDRAWTGVTRGRGREDNRRCGWQGRRRPGRPVAPDRSHPPVRRSGTDGRGLGHRSGQRRRHSRQAAGGMYRTSGQVVELSDDAITDGPRRKATKRSTRKLSRLDPRGQARLLTKSSL